MGKPTGFLEYNRNLPKYKSVEERTGNYKELYEKFPLEDSQEQAARCMDCGIPFCHNGCPLGNIIPEFNDAAYNGDWELAASILTSTNNFPEFTGRICPAPCEASCVLGINQPPVAIEHIEKTIAEKAFEMGYFKPSVPEEHTGNKVAVIGSGPAGLAAAAQLNKAGHLVTVFERADRIGGLLRYGIPDFKLDKGIVERRVQLMEEEGITFVTNANVGFNVPVEELNNKFDAIVLCGGSTVPNDFLKNAPGRELKGIHFAMDFLTQNNKRVAGDAIPDEEVISAKDKHVIVLGGGDTGSDCVGTSNRQGAASVTQFEIMWKPDDPENGLNPVWPKWPRILRTSSSHEEGCERIWSINTKEFIGENGVLTGLKVVDVEWTIPEEEGARPTFTEKPETERILPADMVFFAMGFSHPKQNGVLAQLGVELDDRGNVKANDHYKTNLDKVFTAGDMRRGQSLVVWAIAEGRECARRVDQFLMGESILEARDESSLFVEE
ncbi:MAG: glutamate synthase subunit beta [Bacteroidetes bacterium]|nr:glutamate synthase subunit beta [Bacteroidota bacterium]